jgi:hypothetical protein
MKRQLLGILIFLLCAGLANAQLYPNRFETGDTLVGNTPDTTERCFLYNGNVDNPKPVNPCLWIINTEIGTNTSHNMLQIEVDVADRSLTKAGNGWTRVRTLTEYLSDSDDDLRISLPFLDGISAQYVRFILTFIGGAAADSTAYECSYTAEESGQIQFIPGQTKTITHKELKGDNDYFECIGNNPVYTQVLDFRIEVAPGVYQVPDRGWIKADAGTKTDDDTLKIVMTSWWRGGAVGGLNDTVYVDVSGNSDVCLLSPVTGGGAGWFDFGSFAITNEEEDAEDSTQFYLEVVVECDP